MSNNFRDGVDAGVFHGNAAWFFKGNQAIKIDAENETTLKGPADITAEECWPVLKNTIFAADLDVVLFDNSDNSGFWFIKGNQAIKTDEDGTKILIGPCDGLLGLLAAACERSTR